MVCTYNVDNFLVTLIEKTYRKAKVFPSFLGMHLTSFLTEKFSRELYFVFQLSTFINCNVEYRVFFSIKLFPFSICLCCLLENKLFSPVRRKCNKIKCFELHNIKSLAPAALIDFWSGWMHTLWTHNNFPFMIFLLGFSHAWNGKLKIKLELERMKRHQSRKVKNG